MNLGEFLIDNGVYDQFVANADKKLTINFKSEDEDAVSNYFTFDDSPEGHKFWWDLHEKFKRRGVE